jgi:hypothetical protein
MLLFAAVVTTGLLLGALGLANMIDCWNFKRAISRVETLSPADCEKIADCARKIEARGRFEHGNAPIALKILRPLNGSFSKNSLDALIYEMGDAYIWVRVTTSRSNQQILYFTNSAGPQISKVLWDRNPEYSRSLSPNGRIVTVTQWSSSGRSWIVTDDSIVVVERSRVEGEEDLVPARASIDADDRREIIRAIERIPTASRGKHHNADDVSDGISLEINFSPDGVKRSDDITLSNAWTDEIRPLLATLSRLGPKGYPIAFEDSLSRDHAIEGKMRW